MELDVDKLNLTQICRTCKDPASHMRFIFEGYENTNQSPRIDEMLMACASVQVLWGDGLPSQICQICVEQLRMAYDFKHQVEKIDASLREYVKYVKVEEIKQEPQNLDFEIEANENMDEVKEVIDMGSNDEKNNISETSVVAGNDNGHDHSHSIEKVKECLENEINNLKEEDDLQPEDNIVECENKTVNIEHDAGESSEDTTDSEYLPKESVPPKIKRGRGRPRKNPLIPIKIKAKRRGRGRPKNKTDEYEEYGEFPCPICQQMFNTMSAFNRHARKKHEGLKVYKCNMCNKKFSRASHLNRHVTSHSTIKPHSCHLCTKSFSRSDHLIQHQKSHERSNKFECDICQRVFKREDFLRNHRASQHAIGEKILYVKKYKCPLCSKSFRTENCRDNHVSEHNGQKDYQCRVCEKTFSKCYFAEHMKYHDKHAKKYLCPECGQQFLRQDYLVIHMRRHRGEKPFKCKYCEKGFPRIVDLQVHERYHTGEKTHWCTTCGKGFGRAYNLTLHMRTHTGEKPYHCKYCDAAFKQKNILNVHIRRHTGERFQCELCNKGFLMAYLLNKHKRTVHGLTVIAKIPGLQTVSKQGNLDESSPSTTPLPKSEAPDNAACDIMSDVKHEST